MDLKEIMEQKNFVVVGDTLDENKYAYLIKKRLMEKGYNVFPVGKEISDINSIEEDIDIIDMCTNPVRGLKFIKENKKDFKCIVLQPGAESEELKEYLEENNLPYIEGCLLVGISLYCS